MAECCRSKESSLPLSVIVREYSRYTHTDIKVYRTVVSHFQMSVNCSCEVSFTELSSSFSKLPLLRFTSMASDRFHMLVVRVTTVKTNVTAYIANFRILK